ncbi:IclR family transcriptional regulator [Mesorhizobium sp. CN2-181]|uniref:IclR family transcriptional regulator n=1 Tax=Mesorhizobium yinganensis TaxID=3157707 RepID=UPI0032B789DD
MSSVIRSVQVMDLLARRGPLGVRAVAQQLKLPLGSLHRVLLDLAEAGVVDRTPSGEWELSFRLLEITGLQLERIDLPRLCRPFAERIAEATGETVNVNVLSGHFGVCVDKVRGNEGMQLDLSIGSRGPLSCGGAGKAMLAFMAEDKREEVYAMPLPVFTNHTIADPHRLREEIDRIRERFYSIDEQEVVIGVYCVSVPILDRFGHSAGAISVTGPSVKEPGAGIIPVVEQLWEACEHVSRRLGFAGAWPAAAPACHGPTV